MSAKTLVSSVALTAALFCLPVVASAQEVHTITPHFPDHFKVTTTRISDDLQDARGQQTKTHSQSVVLAETDKTATGYHARYSIVSFDIKSDGPAAEDAQKQALLDAFKTIGKAEVTLDNDLNPVSVDNLDEIKAKLKTAFTSMPELQKDGMGEKLYDVLVGKLTPESAADFLKQSRQAGNFFNQPLTVGKPVAIKSELVQIMGGSFNMNAVVTLQKWEDGKTAHLTYLMSPTEEDLHAFLAGILKTMMGAMIQSDKPDQVEVVQKMIDNMQMNMTLTCDVDYSLANYVDTKSVCDTDTVLTMDMKKMAPAEMLKQNPNLPVITIKQASHAVIDAVMTQ